MRLFVQGLSFIRELRSASASQIEHFIRRPHHSHTFQQREDQFDIVSPQAGTDRQMVTSLQTVSPGSYGVAI